MDKSLNVTVTLGSQLLDKTAQEVVMLGLNEIL